MYLPSEITELIIRFIRYPKSTEEFKTEVYYKSYMIKSFCDGCKMYLNPLDDEIIDDEFGKCCLECAYDYSG